MPGNDSSRAAPCLVYLCNLRGLGRNYRSREDAVRERRADVRFRAGQKPGGRAEALAPRGGTLELDAGAKLNVPVAVHRRYISERRAGRVGRDAPEGMPVESV